MKFTLSYYILLILIYCSCTKKFDGKNGLYEDFYPVTGVLKTSIEYKDGKKYGRFVEYYFNKNIKEEATLINNIYDGARKKYYNTGVLKSEENFSNGFKEGWSKIFTEKGILKSEILYSSGKYNGPFNSYFSNGKPRKLYNFKNGLHHGELKEYYENGQLKFISYFKNGSAGIGLKEYEENGKEIDNDFEIQYSEKNTLLLNGECSYTISFSPYNKTDELFELILEDGKYLSLNGKYSRFILEDKKFKRRLFLEYGKPLLYELNLAGIKKSRFDNAFIKTKKINISISSNF